MVDTGNGGGWLRQQQKIAGQAMIRYAQRELIVIGQRRRRVDIARTQHTVAGIGTNVDRGMHGSEGLTRENGE